MSTTIPCGQLAAPALISRVASTMDTAGFAHPSYRAEAGRCRFCGHPLPHAFAALTVVDGVVKRVEWNPGDPLEAKLMVQEAGAVELGTGVALVYRKEAKPMVHTGLHRMGDNLPDVLLVAQGACEALTESIFREASRVVRERAAKATMATQVNASAKEMAAKRAARLAASALAGTMSRPTPEAVPPIQPETPADSLF